MMLAKPARLLLFFGGLLFSCGLGSAAAQKYEPPPPPLTAAPCVPTKKDPCTPPPVAPTAPQQFPFPGETPSAPGQAPAQNDAAPAASGSQGNFPFPGEPATAAPNAPTGAGEAHPFPGEPAESSSASSSSSSSSFSSSGDSPADPAAPALKDEGSTGSTRFERRHLPKIEDKDNREEEDLKVSKYYASTGNYKAAYLRAKDAVATLPDDPEGHFLLADAASHYGKPDEAKSEFEAYLKLEPDGDHVKAAEQALAALKPR